MSLDCFSDVFRQLGCEVEIEGDELLIDIDENKIRVSVDETWIKAIDKFYKSKQYEFDHENRILTAYRSVEFQIIRLDPNFLPRPDFEFFGAKGDKVKISGSSAVFVGKSLLA